jgi:hypothetical protein
MPRSLKATGGQQVRLSVTPAELRRFARDFVGTVWDNVTGADADYLMLTGTSSGPDGCWAEFTSMREVEGPVPWRKSYRYVGNLLTDPPPANDKARRDVPGGPHV